MNAKNKSMKVMVAFLLLVAMFTAACGSDSEESANAITIGASFEPACLDPVGDCAADAWGIYTVIGHTLPRPYVVEETEENSWEYVPTDLLAKEAELSTDPVQTVTYTLNEDAQWSDGEPITVDDFEYTWKEIVEGENILDSTGYENIESIEAGNDNEVVVTFAEIFAGWKSLFGGGYGLMPAHILEGKDRNAETKDGYEFSGGPFKLKEWEKGQSITIERNDEYWGDQAKLDEVTFEFMSDSTGELKSLIDKEVDVIYPRPGSEVSDAFEANDLDNFETEVNSSSANIEALWFNNSVAPFDSVEVRKAALRTLDRDAIVSAIYGKMGVDAAAQSFLPGVLSRFASTAFDQYTVDTAAADDLLEDDGWTKNSEGKWRKNGQNLGFTIKTTSGDTARQQMMEVIQKQLQDAGWTVTLQAVDTDTFFGAIDEGDFQAAIFQQGATTLNPDNCSIFCSKNIPSEDNDFSGFNSFRVAIDELDELLLQVESELNEEVRIEKSKAAEQIIADQAISAPLAPVPNVLIYNSRITGEISDNPIEGPFVKLSTWEVK